MAALALLNPCAAWRPAVGNSGTTRQYETGQGNNAEAPSGEIYVDKGG